MTESTEKRLVTQAYPVDDLVTMVLSGEVRIPSFQRGLRWTRPDVIKLFDSILRGYPIGNLLLWRRRATADPQLHIGALRIAAPQNDRALYVVDGQQRLTSLANALTFEGHADPRFALGYDLREHEFVGLSREDSATIPLPTIFDLNLLLKWFQAHPNLDDGALDEVSDVAKAIREFRVPVYVVDQSDQNVLRDIFDRMNNYGKQLTRAEVFSALHESPVETSGGSGSVSELSEMAMTLHGSSGFGTVDENTMLLALLARRGADISRDIRREYDSPPAGFESESADEARRQTEVALLNAVRFLQVQASCPHFAFLTYRYLLVVLVRFFAHFPAPTDATIRNLTRWFWRASVRGPAFTKGNITQATRTLCSEIVPGDEQGSITRLLNQIGAERQELQSPATFKTNWAASRIVLSAMWDRKPRDLVALKPFTQDDLLQALGESTTAVRITPFIVEGGAVSAPVRGLAGNRILLAQQPGSQPEDILAAVLAAATGLQVGDEGAALDSHFISPESAMLLSSRRYDEFVRARNADVVAWTQDWLRLRAAWSFEDTPSIASLELADPQETVRDDVY